MASRSATISCSIFIASMTTTGMPAVTCWSADAGVATTVPVNGATSVWLVSAGTRASLRFAGMSEAPVLLWEPSEERVERATLTRFARLALGGAGPELRLLRGVVAVVGGLGG